MINILKDIRNLPCDVIMCTFDASSLYTNIPLSKGIQTINELLAVHRGPTAHSHSSYVIHILRVVFENNIFEFDGKYYHQVAGTAMQTKLAPSYANIFISNFVSKYVSIL